MANRFFDKIPPLMNGRDCILRSFGKKKDPGGGLNSDAKPQSVRIKFMQTRTQ